MNEVWSRGIWMSSSFICSHCRISKCVLIVPFAHSWNDCQVVKKINSRTSSWLWLKMYAAKGNSYTGIAFWLPWPWYLVYGAIKLHCKKWLKCWFYFLSLFLYRGFEREHSLSGKFCFAHLLYPSLPSHQMFIVLHPEQLGWTLTRWFELKTKPKISALAWTRNFEHTVVTSADL